MKEKVKALATIPAATAALLAATPAGSKEDIVEYTASYIAAGCAALLAQRTAEDLPQGRCLGIVETLVMVGPLLPGNRATCKPESIVIGEAARIVVTYINERPARTNDNFWDIANEALAAAWPCKTRPTR